VLISALAGCATVAWYGQAAEGQFELLSSREDIAQLLADPDTPGTLRARLETVLSVRDYAVETLGLPQSRSYTVYADLGRAAPVWSVVAAPEYAVEPRRWCYPLVGCLTYRGFFERHRAWQYAAELSAEGLDTAVFPASAYSTLGIFADPVLESMLRRGDAELAELIFHELTHEKLYVPGATAFNEAYATFVARQGVIGWLAASGRDEALERWRHRRAVGEELSRRLLAAREALAEHYAGSSDRLVLESGKRRIFDRLNRDLSALAERHRTRRFDHWLDLGLNNAHLALVATYESGVAAFERAFEACHRDFACLHRRARELAGGSAQQRARFLAGDH
jgi:predicted aminopeptidase